jgi:uncharacterized protein (TIGR03435 family)
VRRIALLGVLLGAALRGQSSFEVTLVKPHDFSGGGSSAPPSCSTGHFRAAIQLSSVIVWAYQLQPHQSIALVEKLPGWARVGSRAFDIEATANGAVTEAQCRLMVQSLLRDRFHFAAHWETKEGTVFDLAIAPGGHKLKAVTAGDQSRVQMRIDGQSVGFPEVQQGLSMANLVPLLSAFMRPQAPISDQTGLEGEYKIDLTFSLPPNGRGSDKQKALRDATGDPDLSVALRQQLGLRLVERKGPIELLIPDRVELPDEN